jgi:hypothetical protein
VQEVHGTKLVLLTLSAAEAHSRSSSSFCLTRVMPALFFDLQVVRCFEDDDIVHVSGKVCVTSL